MMEGILKHSFSGTITCKFPSEAYSYLNRLFLTALTSAPEVFTDLGYSGTFVVVEESPRESMPEGMFVDFEIRSFV